MTKHTIALASHSDVHYNISLFKKIMHSFFIFISCTFTKFTSILDKPSDALCNLCFRPPFNFKITFHNEKKNEKKVMETHASTYVNFPL